MPATHFSKVFAVEDAKVDAITADDAGGTTTYGTLLDVPGIKELGVDGDLATALLEGDNTVLDQEAVVGPITISVQHAKVHVDVLAVILGGVVTDSGTGTTEVATYQHSAGNKPKPFRLRAKSASADPIGGDVLLTFERCVLSGFPSIGFAEKDYRTVSFEATCIPRLSDGKWFSLAIRETAAAIV